MFDEILAIPESEMIENAHGVLSELDGIKLTTKIRLHLGLMQSVIETIMPAPDKNDPALYTLLIDLGNDLETLIGELEDDTT